MSEIFGKKLKSLREEQGLFQRDIAEELKVSRETVSYWEKGTKEPSIERIIRLCDILKTTPNYLFDYGDEN